MAYKRLVWAVRAQPESVDTAAGLDVPVLGRQT